MGRSLVFAILAMLFASAAFGSAGVTYHGRLLKADSTPVDAAVVQFKIQIRSSGPENCLFYEETHTRNMTTSNGVFAITINDGTASSSNTEPFSLDRVFQNRGTFSFAGGKCAIGSTYSPNPADGRKLVVDFNDGTFVGWEQMPAQTINHVPSAIESMSVGGFNASQLLRVVDGAGAPAAIAAMTQTQHTTLMDILNGTGDILGDAAGFTGTLAGDVTGTQGATSVVKIRGRDVDTAAPSNGHVLKWSAGNNRWEPSLDVGLTSVPDASTTVKGIVELATGAETAAGLAVQANDPRLSDARAPTAHNHGISTGGTGLTTGGAANQVLGMNGAAGAMEYKTIASGTGVNVVHTANTITINATGAAESTAVANVGTAGEGIYRDMTGSTINLRKLNVATGHPLSITLDGANHEIDVGVNAELQALGGLSANGFVRRTGAGAYSSVAGIGFAHLATGVFTNNAGLIVHDGTNFQNKSCLPNEILKWLSPTGWSCSPDAGLIAETDPKIGANTSDFLPKWNGTALVASNVSDTAGAVQIGVSSAGNNTDYSLSVSRHGTSVAPGTYSANAPMLRLTDLSDDGPATLETNGLLYVSAPRITDADTNATNALLLNVRNDTGSALAVNGKRFVGLGNSAPPNLLSVGPSSIYGQTNAVMQARVAGNSFEFGHGNQAGYLSTLGSNVGNGAPFLCFNCEAGTTSNTFRTRGNEGVALTTNNAGSLLVFSAPAVNADNQVPAELMRIQPNGKIGVGTASPQANLDVAGSVRVNTDTANVTCAAGIKGLMKQNASGSMLYCDGTEWLLMNVSAITANTTINVGPTRSLTNLTQAFAYLANKRIQPGVSVVLQLDDASYTHSAGVVMDHPDGERISILGNLTNPDNVTLNFNASTNGLLVSSGNSIYSINGLRLIGTANNVGVGIYAYDNATTFLGSKMKIQSFNNCVMASNGSRIRTDGDASNRIQVSNCGIGFYAHTSSHINAWYAQATNIVNVAFYAYQGSTMNAAYSIANTSGNYSYGAEMGSTLHTVSAQATAPTNYCVFVTNGSNAFSASMSCTNPGHTGYYAHMGSVLRADSATMTGSPSSGNAFMAYYGSYLYAATTVGTTSPAPNTAGNSNSWIYR